MKIEKGRRVRSDKKREIKPTISIELYECIRRLHYITGVPVKDIGEQICIYGIWNVKVMSFLSPNFRRDLIMGNHGFSGSMDRPPVSKRIAPGQTERISIKFSQRMHSNITSLAYALDCTPSRACALLLDATVRDTEFVNNFVKRYLKKHIDEDRMKELKKVLKYINANNPYTEDITWAQLLSFLIDEMKDHAVKVQDTVSDFLDNHWRL